jgi:hypothetical protein
LALLTELSIFRQVVFENAEKVVLGAKDPSNFSSHITDMARLKNDK